MRVVVRSRRTDGLTPLAVRQLDAHLTDEERRRAARFAADEDRRDFIAAHALLWDMLAASAPDGRAAWTFSAGAHGKPFITPSPQHPDPPTFNISHTRGLVACAVVPAGGASVGIDVEVVRAFDRQEDIAAQHFSATERDALARCATRGDWVGGFFDIWTSKEAYIKAIGVGLSAPLAEVPPADTRGWTFFRASPTPETRLAVAVNASGVEVDYAEA